MDEQKSFVAAERTPIKTYDHIGVGHYIGWDDGESKVVVVTNWGEISKEFKGDMKPGLGMDVLKIGDAEFALGDKVIETSAVSLMNALKPFLAAADAAKTTVLKLRITRRGMNQNTIYAVVAEK